MKKKDHDEVEGEEEAEKNQEAEPVKEQRLHQLSERGGLSATPPSCHPPAASLKLSCR